MPPACAAPRMLGAVRVELIDQLGSPSCVSTPSFDSRALVEPSPMVTFTVSEREAVMAVARPAVYRPSLGSRLTLTLPSVPLVTKSRPWSKNWPNWLIQLL